MFCCDKAAKDKGMTMEQYLDWRACHPLRFKVSSIPRCVWPLLFNIVAIFYTLLTLYRGSMTNESKTCMRAINMFCFFLHKSSCRLNQRCWNQRNQWDVPAKGREQKDRRSNRSHWTAKARRWNAKESQGSDLLLMLIWELNSFKSSRRLSASKTFCLMADLTRQNTLNCMCLIWRGSSEDSEKEGKAQRKESTKTSKKVVSLAFIYKSHQ